MSIREKYQRAHDAMKLAELNCGRRFNLVDDRDFCLVQLQTLCLTDGPCSIQQGIITLENGEQLNLHKLIHAIGKNDA